MNSLITLLQLVFSLLLAIQNNPAVSVAMQQQVLTAANQTIQVVSHSLAQPTQNGAAATPATCPPNAYCATPSVPFTTL